MAETCRSAPRRQPEPIPVVRADYLPVLLVPVLALAALPLIGNPTTWVTLTIAALAMGMMIFVIASGLTLVFGLMDVLNFGHGAFIAVGAYLAMTTLLPLAGWMQADSLALNLAALALAMLVAMVGTGAARLGLRARHHHAGLRPAPEADPDHDRRPDRRRAADPRVLGRRPEADAAADRAARRHHRRRRGDREVPPAGAGVGLVVFVAMLLVLNRTKLGLLIRAGVENGEMVEALGYRIRRLFVAVFVAGSALAGLGGTMWALYRETLTAGIGGEVIVLVFIVIIIGGLGSVGGCFLGSILVAQMANYTGYLAPKVALASNILLMVDHPDVAAAGALSRGQAVRPNGARPSGEGPTPRWRGW